MKTHISPAASFQLEEVSLRDGLQREAVWPVAAKMKLVELLYAAGVRRMEVGSLVNPKVVPALANTMELLSCLAQKRTADPHFADLQISVLLPRAASFLAVAASGVDQVAVAISRDEDFQQKNWHNSISQAQTEIAQIFDLRQQKFPQVRIKAYLMMAWIKERPLEQDRFLLDFLQGLADEVCLADTAAAAEEENFLANLTAAAAVIPCDRLSLHLHGKAEEVLRLGQMAAQFGIRKFDTALGGLGGCPFLALPAANADTRLFNQMLRNFAPHQGGEIQDEGLAAAERFLQEMMR